MVQRYRKLLFGLLVVVVLGSLSTFGVRTYILNSKQTEVWDKIRLVELEHSLLALPHYIATAQGFYQEQKLKVEPVKAEISLDQSKLEEQDIVLLGNLSETLFTRPLGTGGDLVAFAQLARRDGTFLVGRNNDEAFDWDKVKRKTILGDAPDEQSNIILEEALRQNKLSLQHQVIIIQNLPPELKEGAFEAEVGHFAQMAEPMASKVEAKGLGHVVASLGSTVEPIPALVLAAPPAYLKQQSNAVQKLVNGLCKGMLWLDYHSTKEAAKVAAPYFPGLNETTLIKIIDRYKKIGLWDKSPVIAKGDYERLQDYVRRAGELTNPVAYADGVNNKFAAKAGKTVRYIPPEQQKEPTLWEKIRRLCFGEPSGDEMFDSAYKVILF
ncbi:ABC transporter substrate-binding protein [Desulfotomaculum nigrificans]|uniref:ABC transporter substrate-binding protein n=1 Tax=Desulfotomaculum nigrificans TaxID=1565 RepID=UPI0001FAEAC3|nr:ABC transporter substrate-binding protein [Desulfotomaculum nigrificans]